MGGLNVIPPVTRAKGLPAVVGLAALYAILRTLGFHRLFPDDAAGIGAILQIVGTL